MERDGSGLPCGAYDTLIFHDFESLSNFMAGLLDVVNFFLRGLAGGDETKFHLFADAIDKLVLDFEQHEKMPPGRLLPMKMLSAQLRFSIASPQPFSVIKGGLAGPP